MLSPLEYNRKIGLAVVCPITNQIKGYPWEVAIPENDIVTGVVLADQIKNLDWRQRRAEFLDAPDAELLEEVVERAFALLSPEEDDLE